MTKPPSGIEITVSIDRVKQVTNSGNEFRPGDHVSLTGFGLDDVEFEMISHWRVWRDGPGAVKVRSL
jgi:hypothetical protein